MAIAGRVAIVPKGDWSADATYKRLDAVTYNNALYFAKKDVPVGTATSNTEYWSKSIVGGAGAIATTEDAGIVKPDGKSMSVDESGTLSINLDGTTITLDEAKNVIKLADTLKDKIGSALQPESIVNNQVTTETGFALDARQANPNIDGTLANQISQLNTDCKNRVLANIPNSKSNVYIKQGTDSNGENCNCMHSGFKFGIPYNYEDNAYPACGIGNMRGDSCIYLSIGMMHHYDKETTVSNWICTKYYPGYYITPIAILLNDMTFRINSVAYGPGVYILSAPNKIYELNEIIPDSDITVTKIG